jgi:hypothetical protein
MTAAERSAARDRAARTTIIDTAEIRAKRAWSRFAASPASSVALATALVVLGSINDVKLP